MRPPRNLDAESGDSVATPAGAGTASGVSLPGELIELASGIDTLNMSGQAVVNDLLRSQLADGKAAAHEANSSLPFRFGRTEFEIEPFGMGKYPYRLSRPEGVIGIHPDSVLPTLRIQPRAEFLHGVGPTAAVEWFRDIFEYRLGATSLSVSRVDLHADFQGWDLNAEDRFRLVCRARARATYEDDGRWTGFTLGRRKTKTVSARIYDKTEEIALISKAGYVEAMWGPRHTPGERVIRVELELAGGELRKYGLVTPEDVIGAAGAMWMHYTSSWLSLREPTGDATKSRWPIAPEWVQVQRCQVGQDAYGLERLIRQRELATLEGLAPGLMGYVSSFAAVLGTRDIEDTLEVLPAFLRNYGESTDTSFADRVAKKAKRY